WTRRIRTTLHSTKKHEIPRGVGRSNYAHSHRIADLAELFEAGQYLNGIARHDPHRSFQQQVSVHPVERRQALNFEDRRLDFIALDGPETLAIYPRHAGDGRELVTKQPLPHVAQVM